MKLKVVTVNGLDKLVPDFDIPIEQTEINLTTQCRCINYSFWHYIEERCVGPYSNTECFGKHIRR